MRKIFWTTLSIGIAIFAHGVYGLLNAHQHVAPHPFDLQHCIAQAGTQVLLFSLIVIVSSSAGLKFGRVLFKRICISLAVLSLLVTTLVYYGLLTDILGGSCVGEEELIPEQ